MILQEDICQAEVKPEKQRGGGGREEEAEETFSVSTNRLHSVLLIRAREQNLAPSCNSNCKRKS